MKFILFLLLLATFIVVTLMPGKLVGLSGFNITNAALYAVGLSLIVSEVMGGKLFKRSTVGIAPAIIISIAVVLSLIYAQFYGVYGGNLTDNLRSAKSFVLTPVLYYCMSFLLVDSREQGKRFLMLLVAVFGVLNLASAIGAQFGVELFRISGAEDDLEDGVSRLAGFTGNPNKTAYLTCILIAFQYYFYRTHQSNLMKGFMAILMFGGLVVVLLSGSRGGLLVLIVMILGMAYKLRDMHVVYATAIVVPAAVWILLATGSPLLESAYDRVISTLSGDAGEVTSGRDVIWGTLLQDYSKDMVGVLFGYGYGVTSYMGTGAEPHNIYLKVLVEFGVVGILIFFYFIFSIFRYVTKVKLIGDEALRGAVLASGYVVSVAWLFTTLVGVLSIVWFVIGIAMATLVAPSRKLVAGAMASESPAAKSLPYNGKTSLLRTKVNHVP